MATVHHPPELQATLNASAKAHNLAPSPVVMRTARLEGPTPNHPPKVVMPFTGPLQAIYPRPPKNPDVWYDKNGSDFRCPHSSNVSSMGHQPISRPHCKTGPRAKFGTTRRFIDEQYRSPGPVYGGFSSSIGKQRESKFVSGGGVGFGTSSRDGAMKQYAVWTQNR